jgi:hypothetical protein
MGTTKPGEKRLLNKSGVGNMNKKEYLRVEFPVSLNTGFMGNIKIYGDRELIDQARKVLKESGFIFGTGLRS